MKTILITGSTDGIGKQTALDLSKLGHHILIHGRNEERCKKTVAEIQDSTSNTNIDYFVADLSSLSQVRRFASEVRKKVSVLDVLINNAGVYMTHKELTEDGFETTFAVNHLSVFVLTLELLDLIKKSEKGRIITVSSIAHSRAVINFNNLQSEQFFDSYQSYAVSKLANVLFAIELSDRLGGTGITSNCLHPGVITTKLLKTGFGVSGDTLEKGAATSVYLAVSKDAEKVTGKYFINKMVISSAPSTYDLTLRKKLWDISEVLCGMKTEN